MFFGKTRPDEYRVTLYDPPAFRFTSLRESSVGYDFGLVMDYGTPVEGFRVRYPERVFEQDPSTAGLLLLIATYRSFMELRARQQPELADEPPAVAFLPNPSGYGMQTHAPRVCCNGTKELRLFLNVSGVLRVLSGAQLSHTDAVYFAFPHFATMVASSVVHHAVGERSKTSCLVIPEYEVTGAGDLIVRNLRLMPQ
jgi:hypothetical protein